MKKVLLTIALIVGALVSQAQNFTLASSSIGGQATKTEEFNGFGCTGDNLSPQLAWKNAPEGTRSYAITIYDPDAPTGSGWWHWVVFDIPANVNELAAGAGDSAKGLLPQGAIESLTNYGQPGYGGPCPPQGHGIHTYMITVHALKTDKLGIDASANPALAGYYINSQTIEKASIVMYYKRD